jgi:hypothetical protein
MRTIQDPETNLKRRVMTPVGIKTLIRVFWGPIRSVMYPAKIENPKVKIREKATKVLAQVRSIPFSATRYKGSMVYTPKLAPIPKLKNPIDNA